MVIRNMRCRRRVASGARLAAAVPVMLALAAGSAAAAAGTRYDAAMLPLVGVAQALQNGPPENRAEFARIALEEMANAYEAEVFRAETQLDRPPPRMPKSRADREEVRKSRAELGKWAASTSGYAQRLRAMSQSIADFTDVTVVVDAHEQLRLVFNGQSIIVSGPRIDQPGPLNQRILQRYCYIYSCDTATAPPESPESPGPAVAGANANTTANTQPGYYSNLAPAPLAADGHWSFTQNQRPVFTTASGLQFTYDDTANLQEKEQRSLALADDLELIARTLKQLRGQGTSIDWASLRMVPTGEGDRQSIVLNTHGDSMVVSLPALSQAPSVWQSSLPWLRQQVEPDATSASGVSGVATPDTAPVTPPDQSRDYIERVPIEP